MAIHNSASRIENGYIYENTWSRARERLAILEARYDPDTIRGLERSGICAGWRCLEVGAGGGSIAKWMCARVGNAGRVVALDIDTRFIESLELANLEVRRQDVAAEPVDTAAFDLVHARMLLEHVPARRDALRNMVGALRPGGWIVLEEFDHITLMPDPAVDEVTQEVWGRFREAYRRLMSARGGDLDYGRRLFSLLSAHGLKNVSAEGRVKAQRGGDGLSLSFHQTRAALVATGAVDDNEMDLVLSLLDDPKFAYMSPLMVIASGQLT